jgi:ferredoxin
MINLSFCLLLSILTRGACFLSSHHSRLNNCIALQSSTDRKDDGVVSSASIFAGTGQAQVDMNRYNLPLDEIADQWSANIMAQTVLTESGAFLGAKNSRDNFADTVKISFPRRLDAGLGIELLEIAGGRDDGLGITVVQGLVEGGSAEGSGIMKGDSIVAVEVQNRNSDSNGVSVATECLGYDATVDAILSLPPASADEIFHLTVKRLRRKPKITLNLQFPPSTGEPNQTLELFSGENLRRAMLTRGVKLNDKFSKRFDSGGAGDCGAEGTCATCVVSVTDGFDLLNKAGIQEQQILVKNPRWRLACKAIVGFGMKEGSVTLRVNPRQWE